MKTRHCWVGTAAIVFLLTTPAFALAYIYDWTSPGVQSVTDPAGDSLGGLTGTDILAAYHASDGIYQYFRMDLAAIPTSTRPPGPISTAETYGFYIDSLPGGAPAGSSSPLDGLHPHIPPVPGIDTIVRSNTDVNGTPLSWTGYMSYQWDSSTGNFARSYLTDMFAHNENGGTTLEWRYDDTNGLMGTNFTWLAANIGPTLGVVNDMTAAVVTPIPSAVWLLGSGIIGLVGLRRRQANLR